MSEFFGFWKMCYDNKWVTAVEVQEAKEKGIISIKEYQQIIGSL